MMAFFIMIYSTALIALVIALLMHWPKLDEDRQRKGVDKRKL